ncbi:leucine rich adaptor protein 1-like [Paramormyrops kingsleyae]|uniref:Leucine rich adaptor protein 1 n=1 Tax=Paramormyrops kingsleyae TaxID=1676925 RepID=A0A3B3R8R1_9TELE|nr:leucine rich adaptor protein 1-like [Paramormyrops kingsleyae]
MEEVNAGEPLLDLKDLEIKVGRKAPEALIKWMREDALHLGERKLSTAERNDRDPKTDALADKIKNLKQDMLSLRSLDVRILRQLVALHEGMESLRWLLEERGPLPSRCSSLTSSQYSLAEGPDTSLRGSWSSLQDPSDRLDNISVGSYLDTLADDTDEYCSAETGLSSTPLVSEAGGRAGAGPGSPLVKPEVPREEARTVAKLAHDGVDPRRMASTLNDGCQTRAGEANCVPDKAGWRGGGQGPARPCPGEKLAKNPDAKVKAYQNGKVDPEGCRLNGRVNLEHEAHWKWVQSQDDVTFL